MELRLIPEFDGTSQSVVEWLDKLELVCRLRGITELYTIVPLRLTGGAFSVYQQLGGTDKDNYDTIKAALISAFAADKFVAYEQFVERRLRDGESVDVYLADLRRLAALFGGIPDTGLSCAFLAGLPEAARHILRAGSRMESMNINQLLNRARAVLASDSLSTGAAGLSQYTVAPALGGVGGMRCHSCNQPNHYARDCLAGRGRRRGRGGGGNVRCFSCGGRGHIATSCPSGNGSGEEGPAPAFSPDRQ